MRSSPMDVSTAFSRPSRSNIHFQIRATTTGDSSTGKKKTDRKKPRALIFMFRTSAVTSENRIIKETWKKTNVAVL